MLTDRLMSLVGLPMTAPAVKAVLEEYGFPRAKKDDALWVPSLGVSLRATRLGPPGKRFLGVGTVSFCASIAQKGLAPLPSPLRDYAEDLPFKLTFRDSRASVTRRLGKPSNVLDDFDEWWFDKKDRKLFVGWQGKKLDSVSWATRWP